MLPFRRNAAIVGGPALALLVATAVAAGPAGPRSGQGSFGDASGAEVGWVKLSEDQRGVVHVNVKVVNILESMTMNGFDAAFLAGAWCSVGDRHIDPVVPARFLPFDDASPRRPA